MTGSPSDDPRDWLDHAQGDLEVAEDTANRSWIRAYHAQQAIEKALKAVLVAAGIAFPYSHDLVGLRAMLPADCSLDSTADQLAFVTKFAAAARYPTDEGEVTVAEADTSLELARSVVAAVQRYLAR